MIKHKHQRVGIFVDAQNMYHSANNLYGANVNFAEILKKAVSGRTLIRAIAYVIRSNSKEEKHFFDILIHQGLEPKVKDLQVFTGGAKKADWDVGIAIDAVKLADKLDVIVLVTGDGDFIPLVKYLQENKGCRVELISFGKTTSGKLIEAVDEYFDIGEKGKKYLIKKETRINKTRTNNRMNRRIEKRRIEK